MGKYVVLRHPFVLRSQYKQTLVGKLVLLERNIKRLLNKWTAPGLYGFRQVHQDMLCHRGLYDVSSLITSANPLRYGSTEIHIHPQGFSNFL